MDQFALRPLSTGEVLDVAFSLYRRRFATLALVALVSQAAAVVFSIYLQSAGGMLQHPVLWVIGAVLSSVCTAIGMGASTKVIADTYLNRATTAPEALRWIVPYLGRIITASLAFSLAVFLGMLLLVIPGIIVGTGLALSACALVVEGLTPMDALNRSWNLTKGSRWKVFLTLLVAMVLIYIVGFGATVIGGLVGAVLGGNLETAVIAIAAIMGIMSILIYPYIYAAVTVLYYDLRVRKEGFDLEVMESQLSA